MSERIDGQSKQIEALQRQADDDWTRFDHRHEEHAQRFNTLLEEVRADWKQMDRFIQASTENIQTLFAEVFSYLAAIGGVDKKLYRAYNQTEIFRTRKQFSRASWAEAL